MARVYAGRIPAQMVQEKAVWDFVPGLGEHVAMGTEADIVPLNFTVTECVR
jgi:hypothetical protein